MKPVDAYYILRVAERDLERLAPDIEAVRWEERTPRMGEIANLLMAVRGIIDEVLEGGGIPELEQTVEEVRARVLDLKENPESAGKHDLIQTENERTRT